MAGANFGWDRREIDGRSWATRRIHGLLQDQAAAFNPSYGAALVSALQGHRLSQGNAPVYGPGAVWFKEEPETSFDPTMLLDKSMIDDRRWFDPFPFDARVERPAPKDRKVRPRNGKAGSKDPDWPKKPGRHDADLVENPLSKALATATLGVSIGSKMDSKKKKSTKKTASKSKPIINQGRHDG